MPATRSIVLLSWTIILASVVGCGDQRETAVGVVQFSDGERVQSGSIEFRSVDRGTRYASRISKDGSFELADQDGTTFVPPDTYEIVVVQIVLTEDLAAEAHTHGQTVPRRYADYYTSDLRITTTESDTPPMVIVLEE
ncbi:carboxypeptidase regulatory-like domain-containing protein [Allorhodopirellula solitaria]|nr:carboxypeptidase regulatory-like domain-containing protein [Allorhodopirellula solitaria]